MQYVHSRFQYRCEGLTHSERRHEACGVIAIIVLPVSAKGRKGGPVILHSSVICFMLENRTSFQIYELLLKFLIKNMIYHPRTGTYYNHSYYT